MEILRKLLELLSDFLKFKENQKLEEEEIQRVKIEQVEKTKTQLKKSEPKPPKKDDFFNDETW